MFGEYVYDHSPALYSDFILINDSEGLNSRTDYINAFAVHGFEIVEYKDDLSFRIEYEKNLKCGKGKIAVLNEKKAYIPSFFLIFALWLTYLLGPVALVRYVIFLYGMVPLYLGLVYEQDEQNEMNGFIRTHIGE